HTDGQVVRDTSMTWPFSSPLRFGSPLSPVILYLWSLSGAEHDHRYKITANRSGSMTVGVVAEPVAGHSWAALFATTQRRPPHRDDGRGAEKDPSTRMGPGRMRHGPFPA